MSRDSARRREQEDTFLRKLLYTCFAVRTLTARIILPAETTTPQRILGGADIANRCTVRSGATWLRFAPLHAPWPKSTYLSEGRVWESGLEILYV